MKGQSEQNQVVQQSFSNFELFANVLRDYDINLHQLDHGSFSGKLQQIKFGNVLVNRVSTTRRFEVVGQPPPGLRTFGVPTNRCLPFTWRHKQSSGNSIQIYQSGTELEMITQPYFEAIDISITEEYFNALLHRWELPELNKIINKREMVVCDPAKFQLLRAALYYVCKRLGNNSEELGRNTTLHNIINYQVPYLLAQTLISSEAQPIKATTSKKRAYALQTALEYIKKTPQKSGAFNEFRRQTGINERTLQRAFFEQYGLSPKAYSQAYHLNNVYKTLIRGNPESTVICEVANHFGFTHMSQFSKVYRRHFGELPSETLNA